MKKARSITSLVVSLISILAIAFLVWVGYSRMPKHVPPPVVVTASSTMVLDQSVSDGTVVVSYPKESYGLATNPTQVLVTSYIPSCDPVFTYCIYYDGAAYKGTNFESAGIRILKRTDLTNEFACLTRPPTGYDISVKPNATTTKSAYATSVFNSVGNAGAGHFAAGSLYRLYYRANAHCYEFETRVGQTQFMNYPEGSIKEFTAADQAAVRAQLVSMLDRVTLLTGESDLFDR